METSTLEKQPLRILFLASDSTNAARLHLGKELQVVNIIKCYQELGLLDEAEEWTKKRIEILKPNVELITANIENQQ